MMKINHICECGSEFNYEGVCENCGLVDEDHVEFDNTPFYPYDDERPVHYGDPRSNAVYNIATMTVTKPSSTTHPELKRALVLDNQQDWLTIRFEIIKKSLIELCDKMGVDNDIIDACLYYLNSLNRKKYNFRGTKIENFTPPLLLLTCRLTGIPLSFDDLKKQGYNIRLMYKIYTKLVRFLKITPKDMKRSLPNLIDILARRIIKVNESNFNHFIELTKKTQLYIIAWWKVEEGDILFNTAKVTNMIAACIYFIYKKDKIFKITQEQVANACGCSEVTVREYLKNFKRFIRSLQT